MTERERKLMEEYGLLYPSDVVPVVRCKDCKYKEDEEPGMIYCQNQIGGWVREDFFCADGERRAEDEES